MIRLGWKLWSHWIALAYKESLQPILWWRFQLWSSTLGWRCSAEEWWTQVRVSCSAGDRSLLKARFPCQTRLWEAPISCLCLLLPSFLSSFCPVRRHRQCCLTCVQVELPGQSVSVGQLQMQRTRKLEQEWAWIQSVWAPERSHRVHTAVT